MNEAPAPAVDTAVAIVGAGPAGLAVAACLKRRGIPFELIERHDAVGSSWRGHYQRLHLHTDKGHSSLPFWPLPRHYPRYPSRQQVVDYLQAYAEHFGLTPRFGQAVREATRQNGIWQVVTDALQVRAPVLVVAAGVNRAPRRPSWPGQDSFHGPVLHSAEYASGAAWRGQRVLVVGLGNSGGEIAIDLCEHGALPTLAVRSPVNVIPREVLGVPFLTMGILQRRLPPRLADALNAPLLRLLVGDLRPLGLQRPTLGPITQINEQGKVPFIDIGTIGLIRRGRIAVRPGIERFMPQGVAFTDGRSEPFDAVVLATGFTPALHRWLDAPGVRLDAEGAPAAPSGGRTAEPGLYFCGYHISPTGMLREIGLEAQRLAALVEAELAARHQGNVAALSSGACAAGG